MYDKTDKSIWNEINGVVVLKKDVPKIIVKSVEQGRKEYSNIIKACHYDIMVVGSEIDPDTSCYITFCVHGKAYANPKINWVYKKYWCYDIKRRRYYKPVTEECRS